MHLVVIEESELQIFRRLLECIFGGGSASVIDPAASLQSRQFVQLTDLIKELTRMATDIKGAIDTLTADVAAQKTVINGFITYEKGVVAQLQAALAAASAAGATDAQLADLVALHGAIAANTSTISDAMVTGTAAANESPAPVVTAPAEGVATPDPATPAA